MANLDSGCKGFVVMECTVRVNFPIDLKDRAEVACRYCPYLSSNERTCQLNKEPVFFPNTHLGEWCPLKQIYTEIKGEKENESD